MAVKTREEILEKLKDRVGNQSDDETIEFLEDVTDTLSDLEEKAKGDGVAWKAKYDENDVEWRKKNTDRFFSSEPNSDDKDFTTPNEPEETTTFEELFKTV